MTVPQALMSSDNQKPILPEHTMTIKPFFVRAEWDEEASVWVATSDDVPGLVTEEATMEGLIQKLKIIVPELLEANGFKVAGEVPFELMTRRFEVAQSTQLQ